MERNSTIENGFARKEPISKPLLVKLVKWTVWVLAAIIFLLFIIYSINSYRVDTDASQIALIRFALFISVVLAFFSVYGFIIDCVYAVREKKFSRLAWSWGYILSLIFGAFIAFAASFILSATRGNL
jgi:hypothetical protein